MMKIFPTGIDKLDRQLDGGVVGKKLVAITIPPESQGEVLLRTLAHANSTLYLSTTRTTEMLNEWLDVDSIDQREGAGSLDVVGTEGLIYRENTTLKEWISTNALRMSGNGNEYLSTINVELDAVAMLVRNTQRKCVIIDPVNPLERYEESQYLQFLHILINFVREHNSWAFLHVVDSPSNPPDTRWLTLQLADEVWELSIRTHKEQIYGLLTIFKSRSGTVPDRQIRITLSDKITIDHSRDIG